MISHNFGHGVQIWPWLLNNVPMLPVQWWALFYALGTIVGMFLLIVALTIRLSKVTPEQHAPPRILPNRPTLAFIIVAGIIFSCAFVWSATCPACHNIQRLAFFVLGIINYSIIALTFIGVWHRLKSSGKNYLADFG